MARSMSKLTAGVVISAALIVGAALVVAALIIAQRDGTTNVAPPVTTASSADAITTTTIRPPTTTTTTPTTTVPTTTTARYCDTDWLLDELEAALAELDASRREEVAGVVIELSDYDYQRIRLQIIAGYAGIATDIYRDSGYSCAMSERHRRVFEALLR